MRVYEFAREFEKDSVDFIQELKSEFGFDIKSHLSGISEEQIEQVRLAYNLKDDLAVQVDDSHTKDLEKTFNATETTCPETIKKEPEFISYELVEKDEETKKMEEIIKKDEESMIKTAEHARKEYAKTVHNITENPDTWHIVTPKEDASSLVLEDIPEETKTLQEVQKTQSLWEKLLLWIQVIKN